jgi:ADP-ribose pyrophosphatase YjhB (NUDIX family)
MLKCGDDHPLPFRRGKWVLPAVIINVGEHPDDAARRVMQNQLGAMGEEPRLVQVQSHVGNHWDLCFIYQCGLPKSLNPPQIFTDRRFIEVSNLPTDAATDHVDVIQQLKR